MGYGRYFYKRVWKYIGMVFLVFFCIGELLFGRIIFSDVMYIFYRDNIGFFCKFMYRLIGIYGFVYVKLECFGKKKVILKYSVEGDGGLFRNL